MPKAAESGTKPEAKKRDGTNITVNLNEILYGRCRSYIIRTQQVTANYVMGELVRDALRQFLDRAESPTAPPPRATVVTDTETAFRPGPPRAAKSAMDVVRSLDPRIAAQVTVGIPEPPTVDGALEVAAESEEDAANREFGAAIVRRCFRELPWFKKATWPVRLERLREMRESGVGA